MLLKKDILISLSIICLSILISPAVLAQDAKTPVTNEADTTAAFNLFGDFEFYGVFANPDCEFLSNRAEDTTFQGWARLGVGVDLTENVGLWVALRTTWYSADDPRQQGGVIIGSGDPSTAQQAGVIDLHLEGLNCVSGHIFDLKIDNNVGEPLSLCIPSGTYMMPSDSSYQRMFTTESAQVTVGPGQTVEVPLTGFCADPSAYPPAPDLPEYVSSPPIKHIPMYYDPFLDEYLASTDAPSTVERLQNEGKLPKTGLTFTMERLTIAQWYIWNLFENFGPEDGKAKIAKQVEESGGTQTPEQIQQLNENIWEGIDLVKKEVRSEFYPLKLEPRF